MTLNKEEGPEKITFGTLTRQITKEKDRLANKERKHGGAFRAIIEKLLWSIKATLSVLETSGGFERNAEGASAPRFDGRTFGTPREWDDASPDRPSASSAKVDAGFSFLAGLRGVILRARVASFRSEPHARPPI